MKRVVALVCAFIMIISLVSVTAFASGIDHVGEVHPNLLDNFSYFTWYNDYYDYESQFPTVSYSGNSTEYLKLAFTGTHSSFSVDQLYFNFTASPSLNFNDIFIVYQSPSGNSVITADFLNSVQTNDLLIYYSYMFDIGDTIQGEFTIEFAFDLIDNFNINVLSLFSNFGSNSISYTGGNVLVQGTLQQGGEGFYNQSFYNNSVSLPYTFTQSFEDHSGPYNNMMELYYRVDTSFVARADQVVITFISTGVYDNYYDHTQLSNGGIRLVSANDTFNIPINAYYSLMDSSWEGMDVWRVSVVADLTGYDLTSSYLDFSTVFFPATPNPSNGGYSSYFFRIESCKFYLNPPMDAPWYRTFYNWIANSLWELNSSINANFDYLEQSLDRYFGGLTESGFDSIDREHIDSELQQGADNNESISGIIDDIDQATPSLPSFDDTGLGEFATDVESDTSPVMPVFLIIYENSFILQMMLYSFMFALGGFLLFGER